jgi:hypothetical protein
MLTNYEITNALVSAHQRQLDREAARRRLARLARRSRRLLPRDRGS